MTQPEDTETKPATGALAKAVGKTFLSMTVTQSRLLLLQLIAYLGTVLAFCQSSNLVIFICVRDAFLFGRF
jgi:hypothetical protein